MAEGTTRSGGVNAIEVGAVILFAIVRIGRPASLTEIGNATGIAPAKLHRYLHSLMEAGLVVQPRKAGHYGLGAGAIEIGLSAIRQNEFCQVVSDHLCEIRDSLDVTCFGAVMGPSGPTVFYQAVSSSTVAVYVRIGSTLPMESSATGWVFGAYIGDAEYTRLCGHKRAEAPPALARRHATIRADRCVRICDEYVRGISALACPIFGLGGQIEGVITALGPTGNFDDRLDGPVAQRLRERAAAVSTAIGSPS